MTFWILVVTCVGSAVAARLLHRRNNMRRFLELHRNMQHLLVARNRFTAATGEEAEFARIPQAVVDQVARHLVKLGDILATSSASAGPGTPSRVFVDTDRTMLVYVALDGSLFAESHTDDGELGSNFRTHALWMRAPFIQHQLLSPPETVETLIAAHREYVRITAATPLRRYDSIMDVIAAWEDIHGRELAWRATQPPDELLEADLRILVGPTYTNLWNQPRVRAALRAQVPRATLREK